MYDGVGATNYESFRDCMSTVVIERLAPQHPKRRAAKGRKNEIKPVVNVDEEDSGDLSDFVEVCHCVEARKDDANTDSIWRKSCSPAYGKSFARSPTLLLKTTLQSSTDSAYLSTLIYSRM